MSEDLSPRDPSSEEVARLLAEAGGPLPVPEDVAARLEATVAALAAERAQQAADAPDPAPAARTVTPVATVTSLPVRRRRWPQALLAAAAVVLGGYAVGTGLVQGGSGGSGDAASSADDGGDSGGVSVEREEVGGDADGGLTAGPRAAGGESAEDLSGRRSVVLRSATLSADVTRLLERAASPEGRATLLSARRGCAPPERVAGAEVFPARLDGRAAALVTDPARDGRVRVTVWSCAGERLATTAVDVP